MNEPALGDEDLRNRTKRKLTLYLVMVGVSAILAPIYIQMFVPELSDLPLASFVLDGTAIGTVLWGGFLLLWPSRVCAPLRRQAFPWHVLFFLALTASSISLAGSISESIQSGKILLAIGFGTGWSLHLYILVTVAMALLLIQIAKMIGPRILGNMLIGRYRNPVEENRIFLFVDLIGSTSLARQLGDLGVQRLLTRFFFDMGQPVAENGGEIHAYVGDEAIITWPFENGAKDGRCVRCFFEIQDVLNANAKSYETLFGIRPRIRAGLHGGSVIVSECGDTKRSIVYFGDTMNTSARLEGEAKRLEEDLVVSAELLKNIQIPSQIAAEILGDVTLRGHDSPTPIVGLSRTDLVAENNVRKPV